ncbi:hypothetical protein BLNAU_17061 [Blattamonas nauphoetae]|uniref:Uncharacterized protein n=1 Tax=Blattamonas nauphoetae TaxID=2049346 RepID=A0ABQ9XCS5_9EUKA|nr:hypothetical protein BLNAU_17061 [Blattamonas nauphoetae]
MEGDQNRTRVDMRGNSTKMRYTRFLMMPIGGGKTFGENCELSAAQLKYHIKMQKYGKVETKIQPRVLPELNHSARPSWLQGYFPHEGRGRKLNPTMSKMARSPSSSKSLWRNKHHRRIPQRFTRSPSQVGALERVKQDTIDRENCDDQYSSGVMKGHIHSRRGLATFQSRDVAAGIREEGHDHNYSPYD